MCRFFDESFFLSFRLDAKALAMIEGLQRDVAMAWSRFAIAVSVFISILVLMLLWSMSGWSLQDGSYPKDGTPAWGLNSSWL